MLTFAVTGTVPLEKTPRGLEFDPNGRRLYITQAGSESVAVVDPRAAIKLLRKFPWVCRRTTPFSHLTASEG